MDDESIIDDSDDSDSDDSASTTAAERITDHSQEL